MVAIEICNDLYTKILDKKSISGQIHSVFKKTVNIVTEDNDLVAILVDKKDISPMGIVVKASNLQQLGFKQGMSVTFKKDVISVTEMSIDIEISKAKKWNPQPVNDFKKTELENIKSLVEYLEDGIFYRGKHEGIAPIVYRIGSYLPELASYTKREIPANHYTSFIESRFVTFLENVVSGNRDNIGEYTKQIIGFGPGLTPSVDDFITGLMVSLYYNSRYFELDTDSILEFNRNVIGEISNKTTRISEEMLKFASIGQCSGKVRNLVLTILRGSGFGELDEAIDAVLSFGDTSGTDITSGIYVGFRIMFNEKSRRLLANESTNGN
ncbi:MAG: DUF2877 domain-containing protein [Firmicutes bacterium]|jgi:hypothetical protein|nr:DUF2877 domain-containing protein [Bacillota bacterium]